MRARLRVGGTDGAQSYSAGEECARDSEWLRRLLMNGLAEPLDGEARTFCNQQGNVERYQSPALQLAARDTGMQPENVPAVRLRNAPYKRRP